MKPMTQTPDSDVLIYAVGDIGLDRSDTDQPFDLVRSVLIGGDVVFAQLELPLTEGGTRLPQARHTVRGPVTTAPSLKKAGFTVISLAGNHCMDWGREALLETIDRLEQESLSVVGAGVDIKAARAPAVAEAKGKKVAFLAYSSILPMSYWADERRAGCAPMRAWTIYEQVEHDQPGTPSRTHTFPNRDDLKALRRDIAEAKKVADIVIVSIHWGIHFIPAVIADYQRDVAYAAIDEGAEMILGHHAHILKGIELYRGKPIFYSLSNFAMDSPMDAAMIASQAFREIQTLNPNWHPSPDRLFNFPEDSRKTLVVKAVLAQDGSVRTSFIPAFVNNDDRPELLEPSDPRFGEVIEYIRVISADAGIGTRFEVVGGEVFMSPLDAGVAA
jgi:poly-gamma-glutamate capsule biosynthesis protein CapA/YwtB (metallophosphatase superfamily)